MLFNSGAESQNIMALEKDWGSHYLRVTTEQQR